MNNLKETIGNNLSKLRKESGKTQTEIANLFSYTDKAVSKWENGDTLPDVETLYKLAKFYGVSLDYLTDDISSEEKAKIENQKLPGLNIDKILIVCLAECLIWMTATIIYVWLLIFNKQNIWQSFVFAIPLSCLLLFYFNKIWGKKKYFFYIGTLFIWSLITSVYFFFLRYNLWPLFLIGVPAEIILILTTRIKYNFLSKKYKS